MPLAVNRQIHGVCTVFGLLVAFGVDSGAKLLLLLHTVTITSLPKLYYRFRSCYGGFGFYNHWDIMTKMVWSQGGHIERRLLYLICHPRQTLDAVMEQNSQSWSKKKVKRMVNFFQNSARKAKWSIIQDDFNFSRLDF